VNDWLDDSVAELLLGISAAHALMYLIKRFAAFDRELRAHREQAHIRHLTSRRGREALQLPAVAPRTPQRPRVDLLRWAVSQLEPADAARCEMEFDAHLDELIRLGHTREAGVDRRRLVRHALVRAASQRLRQPCRRSLSTADAATFVELQNRFVRYLLVTGQRRRAVHVAHHAMALAAQHLAKEHPEALTSRIQLPDALQWAGCSDAALCLAERVPEDCERLLGPEHELTLKAWAQLALSYQWAGRNTDALALYEQVIAARSKQLGREHPATLKAKVRHAWSLDEAGHYTASVTIKRKLLDLHLEQFGPEHLDTLTSRGSLARSLRLAGEYDKAITHLEATLSARERLCGHEHPDTLWARANLGKCYELVGRISEAIAAQQAVVPVCARILGPQHHDTLMYLTYLSSAYQAGAKLRDRVGRGLDEAIRIVEDVVRHRAKLHSNHPDSIEARAQQARAYHDAGRIADAIAIMQRVIPHAERVRGNHHPFTSDARDTLADWKRQDRGSPPRPTRRERARERARRAASSTAWRRRRAQVRAKLRQGRRREAAR
jgi:tetratricopeptide (TPR) repeat protein